MPFNFFQSGFSSNCSTETALIKVLNDIYAAHLELQSWCFWISVLHLIQLTIPYGLTDLKKKKKAGNSVH